MKYRAVALLSVVLVGCGGGGGGTTNIADTTILNLNGSVFTHENVSFADVNFKCANGVVGSTSSTSTGTYSIRLASAQVPCLIKVSGGNSFGTPNNLTIYSVATEAGVSNVSLTTNYILSVLMANDIALTFETPIFTSFSPTLIFQATSLLDYKLGTYGLISSANNFGATKILEKNLANGISTSLYYKLINNINFPSDILNSKNPMRVPKGFNEYYSSYQFNISNANQFTGAAINIVSKNGAIIDFIIYPNSPSGYQSYSSELYEFIVPALETLAQGELGMWIGFTYPPKSDSAKMLVNGLATDSYEFTYSAIFGF